MKIVASACFGLLVSMSIVPSAQAQEFDLAGVELGMTPDAAVEALEAAGYTPYKAGGRKTHIQTGPSFEQLVQRRNGENIPRKQMKEISVTDFAKEASDGSRERLTVRFTPFEAGLQSTEIVYSTNSKKLDASVFKERAISKFGAPDSEVINPASSTWIGDEDLVLDIYPAEEKLVLKRLGLRIWSKANTGAIERTLRDAPMEAPAETTF